MNKLAIIANESGIEKTKAQSVLEQFQAFFQQASEWESKAAAIVITDVSQKKEMKLAHDARMNLRDIRTGAERTKKKLKEGILVEGKLIDAMYNTIVGVVKPIEDGLLEKEKFAERKEAERVALLSDERSGLLLKYGVDPSFYQLGTMSEEAFSMLLENSRLAHESRIETARREEEARIAREAAEAEERARKAREEAEERARIEAENARLKAEREERERKEAEERRRHAEELRKKEEEAAKARAELERIAREKREAEEAERKKIEQERIAAEEEKRRLEQAGDREKLLAYFRSLLDIGAPTVKSAKGQQILDVIYISIQHGISSAEAMKK